MRVWVFCSILGLLSPLAAATALGADPCPNSQPGADLVKDKTELASSMSTALDSKLTDPKEIIEATKNYVAMLGAGKAVAPEHACDKSTAPHVNSQDAEERAKKLDDIGSNTSYDSTLRAQAYVLESKVMGLAAQSASSNSEGAKDGSGDLFALKAAIKLDPQNREAIVDHALFVLSIVRLPAFKRAFAPGVMHFNLDEEKNAALANLAKVEAPSCIAAELKK